MRTYYFNYLRWKRKKKNKEKSRPVMDRVMRSELHPAGHRKPKLDSAQSSPRSRT